MERFGGFSREMPEFLFALRFCNDPAHQTENLARYRQLVSEPLEQLFWTLLPEIRQLDPELECRPGRCISSPYTDRRFSPGVPLKEYMYLRFCKGAGDRNLPGLFFDMGPEYYGCGLRYYKQNAAGMEQIRTKISEKPDAFTECLQTLLSLGFALEGEALTRDRCPWLSAGPAKDLYNRRSLCLCRDRIIGESVYSPELAKELPEAFRQLWQLQKLLEE